MGRPRKLSETERADLLAQGYRPVEVWVPDWDSPEMEARLKREAEVIAEADARDLDIDEWVRQLRGDLWDDAQT